jgi:hypothetical protein
MNGWQRADRSLALAEAWRKFSIPAMPGFDS